MSISTEIPDGVGFLATVVVAIGTTVWSLAWWLSGQFSSIRSLLFEQIEKAQANIVSKLEYHEKHDDSRFDDLKRDIWEVKLRAASVKKEE